MISFLLCFLVVSFIFCRAHYLCAFALDILICVLLKYLRSFYDDKPQILSGANCHTRFKIALNIDPETLKSTTELSVVDEWDLSVKMIFYDVFVCYNSFMII